MVTFEQQVLNKLTNKIRSEVYKVMMIVGQVSNVEQAKEIESITKSFIVGNRARELALKIKEA